MAQRPSRGRRKPRSLPVGRGTRRDTGQRNKTTGSRSHGSLAFECLSETKRLTATAVLIERQDSGRPFQHAASEFRRLPVNAKKRGELAQAFLQGVLEARQATAKIRFQSRLALMNVITRRVNSSGFSMYMRWPESSTTMRRELGIPASITPA